MRTGRNKSATRPEQFAIKPQCGLGMPHLIAIKFCAVPHYLWLRACSISHRWKSTEKCILFILRSVNPSAKLIIQFFYELQIQKNNSSHRSLFMLQWWPKERDADDKPLRCDCRAFLLLLLSSPLFTLLSTESGRNRKRKKFLCASVREAL